MRLGVGQLGGVEHLVEQVVEPTGTQLGLKPLGGPPGVREQSPILLTRDGPAGPSAHAQRRPEALQQALFPYLEAL
jgi:hypothetical protein